MICKLLHAMLIHLKPHQTDANSFTENYMKLRVADSLVNTKFIMKSMKSSQEGVFILFVSKAMIT